LFKTKFKDNQLICAETIEEGINLINTTVKAIILVSGRMG
jgi:hypothetical protein